jgi:hypothetical protein
MDTERAENTHNLRQKHHVSAFFHWMFSIHIIRVPFSKCQVASVDAKNRPMVLKQRIEPWHQPARQQFYYMPPADKRMMINLDYEEDR